MALDFNSTNKMLKRRQTTTCLPKNELGLFKQNSYTIYTTAETKMKGSKSTKNLPTFASSTQEQPKRNLVNKQSFTVSPTKKKKIEKRLTFTESPFQIKPGLKASIIKKANSRIQAAKPKVVEQMQSDFLKDFLKMKQVINETILSLNCYEKMTGIEDIKALSELSGKIDNAYMQTSALKAKFSKICNEEKICQTSKIFSGDTQVMTDITNEEILNKSSSANRILNYNQIFSLIKTDFEVVKPYIINYICKEESSGSSSNRYSLNFNINLTEINYNNVLTEVSSMNQWDSKYSKKTSGLEYDPMYVRESQSSFSYVKVNLVSQLEFESIPHKIRNDNNKSAALKSRKPCNIDTLIDVDNSLSSSSFDNDSSNERIETNEDRKNIYIPIQKSKHLFSKVLKKKNNLTLNLNTINSDPILLSLTSRDSSFSNSTFCLSLRSTKKTCFSSQFK